MPKPRKSVSNVSELEQLKSKTDSRFICKPLLSFSEIMLFLENPPPWRTLCKEMTPHSDLVIRNIDINKHTDYHSLDNPETFCHFDSDLDEVRRHESKSLPKTLVCHDMANNYHDDCMIDGTSNWDAYTFYNWAGIDIFCYFSHRLVTIPPVGWINIGHAHGVKVIGTIITEWSEGADFWDEMLSSELQYRNLASALVAIAKTLKFDGYLLNVENKVTVPEMLLKFVQYFHRLLHEELPHATLLWYDSVTIEGNLSWQNKLCDKNLAFFEACDGLFTNYSWTPEDVESSAEQAVAIGRLTDLYIGIDVWGRNFFGGGQFNTQEAIKVVHGAGCSIALFAPAWTHEALSYDSSDHNHVAMADDLHNYGRFLLRDRAFWGSIWPFLNTRLPCHIPFQSSFCRGQGNKRWLYGEMLCPSPWFNLRHQQYQPNAAHGPHGYLLTSIENLAKVKNDVQYKDKKGIIRIRASFLQARSELLAVSKEAQPAASSGSIMSELSSESRDRTDPPSKSKVNALKNLFKPKSLKISEQEESTAAIEGPSASSVDLGSAVYEPPVSLRLSRKDATRYGLAYVADERQCLELHHGDGFSGGACLMVHPSDETCSEHRYTRLLHCDFPCHEGLIFCVVTKNVPEFPEQTLNVKLNMRNARKQFQSVVLTGRALAQRPALGARAAGLAHVDPLRAAGPAHLDPLRAAGPAHVDPLRAAGPAHVDPLRAAGPAHVDPLRAAGPAHVDPLRVAGPAHVDPLRVADADVLRDLRTYLLLTQPGFYVPIDNAFGWTVRYYEIHVPGARITSVNLRTGVPVGPILLGHLCMWNKTKDESWMQFIERPVEKEVKSTASAGPPAAPSVEPSTSSYEDQCVAQ